MSDNQARLDAALALLPELRLRFRTSPSHPVHKVFDALDALAAERVVRERDELREVEVAAREYVGPEPLALLARMDAGEPLVGAMADPRWVRLVRALARGGDA